MPSITSTHVSSEHDSATSTTSDTGSSTLTVLDAQGAFGICDMDGNCH